MAVTGKLISVQARIEGRVQGVWYRGWTVDHAAALGLTGWVRNRRDGTVEALFQGPEAAVERMLALCREGPPQARVVAVTSKPAEAEPVEGFEQRPTV